MKNLTFTATADKGSVSAIHQSAEKPMARFVMGHGAGANMSHLHMQSLANALAANNIETLRYNFPYMETGGGRTDSLPVCLETIGNALELSNGLKPELPTFLCGHSFGGRMSSHFASERQPSINGVVYFSFPLHASKKPDTKRAANLSDIKLPQLYISGTRDTLADLDLLEPIIGTLANAQLYKVATADHGFKVLKRTRQSNEDVYTEVGRIVREFVLGNL
jgi:predicted alpha/beta-hydrolase family hydrolase